MDDKVIVDLLGQVGRLFTSSLELKETIDFMLKATSQLVACDAATVFLADPEGRTLAAMATFPYVESVGKVARFDVGEGIVGWVMEHLAPLCIADLQVDPRLRERDWAKAIETFQAVARELGPRDFLFDEVQFALARVQELGGKPADAITTYERVLKDTPTAPRIEEAKQQLMRLGASRNK